jgi:hypothetical protein
MDNVRKHNIHTNVPSSQTFRSYLQFRIITINGPYSMMEIGFNFYIYPCRILHAYTWFIRSRDSSAGTATIYGLDDQGVVVRVPVRSRIFSSTRHPDRMWRPPSLLSNGYRGALSPGVKPPGCETDHSPPTSAEVKKMWIYISTPPYAFIA